MKQRIFTLRQGIEEGTVALEKAGVEDAARDAWYLLEYVTEYGSAVSGVYQETEGTDSSPTYYRGAGIHGISFLRE